MTPERQRIKIAEACGWKPHPVGWCVKHPHEDRCVLVQETARQCEDWKRGLPASSEYKAWVVRQIMSNPPDYLNDLNAMQSAVIELKGKQRDLYEWHLCMIVHDVSWDYVTATSAQRAEAFLKTLNLWEE